jgi:hypothetical protein
MIVGLSPDESIPTMHRSEFGVATLTTAVLVTGIASTPASQSRCVHGLGWLVRNLGIAVLKSVMDRDHSISEELAQAVVNVNALHISTCDVYHPEFPSCAVVLLQELGTTIDYLVLGNVALLMEVRPIDSYSAIGDLEGDWAPRHQSINLIRDSSHQAGSGTSMIHLTGNPKTAYDATHGSVPREKVLRAALLSEVAADAAMAAASSGGDLSQFMELDGPMAFGLSNEPQDRGQDPIGREIESHSPANDRRARILCMFER